MDPTLSPDLAKNLGLARQFYQHAHSNFSEYSKVWLNLTWFKSQMVIKIKFFTYW